MKIVCTICADTLQDDFVAAPCIFPIPYLLLLMIYIDMSIIDCVEIP